MKNIYYKNNETVFFVKTSKKEKQTGREKEKEKVAEKEKEKAQTSKKAVL